MISKLFITSFSTFFPAILISIQNRAIFTEVKVKYQILFDDDNFFLTMIASKFKEQLTKSP